MTVETLILMRDQYYTDGDRLYRIIRVHKDSIVTVENCSTLFQHEMDKDTLHTRWKLVKNDLLAA